jgi:hypothetical protein
MKTHINSATVNICKPNAYRMQQIMVQRADPDALPPDGAGQLTSDGAADGEHSFC